MKRILSLMLVLMLVLALFAGCTQEGSVSGLLPAGATVPGLYKLKSVNGKPIREGLVEAVGGEEALDRWINEAGFSDLSDFITLDLNADGTCTISELGRRGQGTWTQEGSEILLTIEDSKVPSCTWVNGVITFTFDESDSLKTMTLQKVG